MVSGMGNDKGSEGFDMAIARRAYMRHIRGVYTAIEKKDIDLAYGLVSEFVGPLREKSANSTNVFNALEKALGASIAVGMDDEVVADLAGDLSSASEILLQDASVLYGYLATLRFLDKAKEAANDK